MDFIYGANGVSDRDYSNSSSVRYSMSSSFYPSSSVSPQPNATARRAPASRLPSKMTAPSSAISTTPSPPPPETRLPGHATPPAPYLPPSPPPSSLAQKHEQSVIPPSGKSIFHQLSHHLRKHRFALHSEHHPIHIPNVSPANFEAFLKAHSHDAILKGIDLEYDSLAGQIIMCPPPAPYHDCMPVFLQDVLVGLRNTAFDTPARQRTLSVREIRFRSQSGSYMVPDAAVVVMSRDGDVRVWPTIVVEVANSQEYDNVLKKARRWFVQSEGMVEVVLVVKFTAKDPLLDPACYLEAWRYGKVVCDEAGDGGCDEQLDVDCDRIDGDRMTGDAHEDVDAVDADAVSCEDAHPGDVTTDTIVPSHEDSDSSLSSLSSDSSDSEHQLAPSEHTHHGHPSTKTPTLADEPTENSLTSPPSNSSAASDVAAHDQSLDTASTVSPSSSSSSDSTSNYDPLPKHDLILSGARKTILPLSDPADPEMRYLALLYSDFFGSENVPTGRDPAEQVLLDLDELREEIRMLIRMTAKQEEPVAKRQVDAADGGPGRKRVRR